MEQRHGLQATGRGGSRSRRKAALAAAATQRHLHWTELGAWQWPASPKRNFEQPAEQGVVRRQHVDGHSSTGRRRCPATARSCTHV